MKRTAKRARVTRIVINGRMMSKTDVRIFSVLLMSLKLSMERKAA